MNLNGVEIEDTYCEAFGCYFSRVLITAKNKYWLDVAANVTTGYGTSTIHCDSEAGIDVYVPADKTPDKRPGAVLMFCVTARSREENGKKITEKEVAEKKIDIVMLNRLGQCVLTCPTTAAFDAFNGSLDPTKEFQVKTGYKLKFFGDKFEEKLEGKFPFEAWKIPVMDGDFVCQSVFKGGKGIAGGNLLIVGKTQDAALQAAEKAVEAIKMVENTITPFPGGIARSGSKVGSKYSFLNASTNEPLCPGLRTKILNSQLKEGENCVYEVIVDGATEDAVKNAIKKGIEAATKVSGLSRITAGNYGGKLGKYQYKLHEILK